MEQRDYLKSDVDVHKMEISRQEHLICRQQRDINDLTVKLENALEQMEVWSMITSQLILKLKTELNEGEGENRK